ncbi:hypothetical protein [Sodaliphilus sp.]|uniref:hypothetical protein n=1 Tax=Sodaliphilus sp. TaxID=2815818 RepID=UPI00388FDFCB
MKKLVYLFAIVLGVSFASCVHDQNGSNQEEQAVVENAAGGDSIDVKDNAQEGDSLKKDAPADEAQATDAQNAKAEEAK